MNTAADKSDAAPNVAVRHRFSLFNLLEFVLLLCVVFALMTQWRHVGFAAAAFIVGIAIGWRFRRPGLCLAATAALLVYVTTYVACWSQLAYREEMDAGMTRATRMALQDVAKALDEYRQFDTEKRFPASLDALPEELRERSVFNRNGALRDAWNRPLHYERTSEGYRLISLGRDGVLGGKGLDADLSADDPPQTRTRLTLAQFLFELPAAANIFPTAVIASLCAAFITRDLHRSSRPMLITGLIATTVFSAGVALFLASFHVAASQSGH